MSAMDIVVCGKMIQKTVRNGKIKEYWSAFGHIYILTINPDGTICVE